MSIENEIKKLTASIEALTATISGGDFKIKLELPPKAETEAEPAPTPKLKVVGKPKPTPKTKGVEDARSELITLLNDVSKKGHRKEALEILGGRKVPELELEAVKAVAAELAGL